MTVGEVLTSLWNASIFDVFLFLICIVITLGLISGALNFIEFIIKKLTR